MGDSVMVFAPHPDDEVIGCFGTILDCLKTGVPLRIVYVTTGATKSEERKVELREATAKKIMGSLGVKEENLIFLRYAERSISEENVGELIGKVREVIQTFLPNSVFVPTFEGGHVDHDITHIVVRYAVRKVRKKNRDIGLYEYAMYNNYLTPLKAVQVFVREVVKKLTKGFCFVESPVFIPKNYGYIFRPKTSREEVKQKNEVILRYLRNFELPLRIRTGVPLNSYKADLYRKMPFFYDYMEKPHGFLPLGYELAFGIPFEHFKKLVNRNKQLKEFVEDQKESLENGGGV